MKKFLPVVFCLALAACGTNSPQNSSNAVSNQAQINQNQTAPPDDKPKFNPAETVSYSIEKPPLVTAGGAGEIEIRLKIKEPFHVNSNPPGDKNLIPLEINLDNAAGLNVGKLVYPKGVLKKFAFSPDKEIPVYDGEIVVKIPLRAEKSAAGQKTLNGKLSFQPCDEEVCYRPQKINIEIPVSVN